MAPEPDAVTPGLAALLRPFDAAAFLADHWPGRPLVVHGALARFGALGALPALAGPRALARAWRGGVEVNLPDKGDEHSAIHVDAAEGVRLYENGMAVGFPRAERWVPELGAWVAAVAADLGLPTPTFARAIAYATPAGKGVTPHFDQNANFVVQLAGTKRWRLAPNAHVTHPTERYAMNMAAPPLALAADLAAALPTRLPPGHDEVVLAPGSLLFLPRGHWHATEAEGEAFSVNLTYSQPTWGELLARWVRGRLARHAHWRALADGVTAPQAARRAAAAARLAELLAGLAADLGPLAAATVIEETRADAVYVVPPGAALAVADARVTLTTPDGAATDLDAEAEELAVLTWIAGRPRGLFRAREAAAAFAWDLLPVFLALLVEQGVLHRYDPPGAAD